jgi:DNA-binding LytR/AlgR family response regulator
MAHRYPSGSRHGDHAGVGVAEESTSRYATYLAVPHGRRLRLIRTSAIEYVEAAGRHCIVSLGGAERLSVPMSLGLLERRLDPDAFVRVSRATLIRIDALVEFEQLHHGDMRLLLASGAIVRTSRRPERLLALLRHWLHRPRGERTGDGSEADDAGFIPERTMS